MSTVEALRQKASTPNYVYLKILQKYKFTSNEVHYVFEGYEDQSFYFNYLQTLSYNYITHISLGKNQSIDLYNKIDWSKYDKKRIVLFIDRDYSRILNYQVPSDTNIYETTFYSIENYINDKTILRRLINEILHYHEEEIIDKIISKYESEYTRYITLIKPVIAWILTVRREKLKANLNQIDIAKLFALDVDLNLNRIKMDRIKYLERVTNVKPAKIYLSEFKYWYKVIEVQTSCKLIIRGKYDAWFLITFFNKVNKFLKTTQGHDSKMKTNINLANALEIIGPRTIIPERLNAFIESLK